MVVSEVYKWLQGPLGSVVMVCFATPGGGLGAGGVKDNIKEWEAVLPRMCVADICTPRQRRKHYYLVCLRRMVRNQDLIYKPVGVGLTLECDKDGRS